MQRVGKYFELGYPHFKGGIDYPYPHESYYKPLEEKMDELAEPLLEKLQGYIAEFKIHSTYPRPYEQRGRQGLCLHLGYGGRWIEIWDMMGCHFINGHNLDSYSDRAACFNIGSDILEHLDQTLLAPRISAKDEIFTLTYPLPHGINILPTEKMKKHETNIRELFRHGKFGEITFDLQDTYQEIKTGNGIVHIEKGICEGRNFQGWSASHVSWPIASLLYLSKDRLD
ncbi:MAG: hypothetical protein RL557_663 [archaeon]|jgi:hypothetical protein